MKRRAKREGGAGAGKTKWAHLAWACVGWIRRHVSWTRSTAGRPYKCLDVSSFLVRKMQSHWGLGQEFVIMSAPWRETWLQWWWWVEGPSWSRQEHWRQREGSDGRQPDWFGLMGTWAGGAHSPLLLLSWRRTVFVRPRFLLYVLSAPWQQDRSEAWSAMELAMQAENENMGPCSKGPESLKSGPSEHKDRKAALFCQG